MKKRAKKYRIFLAAALFIAVMVGLYGYSEYNRSLPDTHYLEPAFRLEASNFIKQFETDESKANAKYADQTISVHGIAHTIETTDTTATVFLNDGYSGTSVVCQFGGESNKETKDLKKGALVTIKGICSGYLMDVVMVRCVLDHDNSNSK
jgi:hypothetical protein